MIWDSKLRFIFYNHWYNYHNVAQVPQNLLSYREKRNIIFMLNKCPHNLQEYLICRSVIIARMLLHGTKIYKNLDVWLELSL